MLLFYSKEILAYLCLKLNRLELMTVMFSGAKSDSDVHEARIFTEGKKNSFKSLSEEVPMNSWERSKTPLFPVLY